MTATYTSFLSEALCLPSEQRSRLATVLIDSLDDNEDASLSPAWKDEVKRRASELDNGSVKAMSFDEFRNHVEDRVA